MSNEWIPIGNFPLINFFKQYEVTVEDGSVSVYQGKEIPGTAIAVRPYEPTPYVPLTPIDPGEGYRLLGKDEPKQAGDEFTDPNRETASWQPSVNDGEKSKRLVYRRRIEPKYRPFANAAEYKPHRERWLVSKHGNDWLRLKSFSDESDWDALYELWLFEDTGTPFGVEVTK